MNLDLFCIDNARIEKYGNKKIVPVLINYT